MDKIQNPLTLRWIQRDGRTHRFLQLTGVLPSHIPQQTPETQSGNPHVPTVRNAQVYRASIGPLQQPDEVAPVTQRAPGAL